MTGTELDGRAIRVDFSAPKPKPSGTGCFKCGEEGHRGFECPKAGGGSASRGGAGGRGRGAPRGRGGAPSRGGRPPAPTFSGTKMTFDDE